jgi:hypothetical protein
VDNWINITKIVSGKKVLEEHSFFQIVTYIIGFDTGSLVFLVFGVIIIEIMI